MVDVGRTHDQGEVVVADGVELAEKLGSPDRCQLLRVGLLLFLLVALVHHAPLLTRLTQGFSRRIAFR